MRKEFFEDPEMELIEISQNDVVATSGEQNTNGNFTLGDIVDGGEF